MKVKLNSDVDEIHGVPPSISLAETSGAYTEGAVQSVAPKFATTGSPKPSVRLVSSDLNDVEVLPTQIAFNNLAAVPAGTYVTEIVASNGLSPDATATYTLIFKPKPVPPGAISGDGILNVLQKNAVGMSTGAYTINAGGESYPMDVIVYEGDTTFSASQNFAGTQDTKGLVVIVKGDLTINSGVTIQPSNRRRGFFLFVTGKLVNNGLVTMTARGASAPAQIVNLYKQANGVMESVPAYNSSAVATGRALGKGKQGEGGSYGGVGGMATSYSGGPGGGGGNKINGGSGSNTGGAGGQSGTVAQYGTIVYHGGGAGNPGGSGIDSNYRGKDGTGGLLVVYAKSIAGGDFTSLGSDGGKGTKGGVGGGGSGGGSVNLFYTDTISVSIGASSVGGGANGQTTSSTGTGTVTQTKIAA